MLIAVYSVLTVFIMIFVGFYFAKKGLFNETSGELFTKMIIAFALPAMSLYSLYTNFSKTDLLKYSIFIFIPLISVSVCALVAFLISYIIKVPFTRRGLFITMFFASNTIFMGMPINISLFGEKSVPFLLIYYAINNASFWILGVWLINRDTGTKGHLFMPKNLKKLVNPPLIALLISIIIVLVEIPLPDFFVSSLKYLGGLTTPLSLLFIGITFTSIKLKDISINKEMIFLMLGRFILSPAIILALGLWFNLPSLMLKVFVIQAGMPIITQAAISSKYLGADFKYGSSMVTISNVLSLVFIPIYMMCFGLLKL